jgi:hypothetical protein
MKPVRFHPAAEKEFEAAIERYEEQREGTWHQKRRPDYWKRRKIK